MTERFPAPCKTPGAFFTDSTKGGSRKIGNLVLQKDRRRLCDGTESLLTRTGDQICAESICGGCAGILYEESAADDKQAGTSQYL